MFPGIKLCVRCSLYSFSFHYILVWCARAHARVLVSACSSVSAFCQVFVGAQWMGNMTVNAVVCIHPSRPNCQWSERRPELCRVHALSAFQVRAARELAGLSSVWQRNNDNDGRSLLRLEFWLKNTVSKSLWLCCYTRNHKRFRLHYTTKHNGIIFRIGKVWECTTNVSKEENASQAIT